MWAAASGVDTLEPAAEPPAEAARGSPVPRANCDSASADRVARALAEGRAMRPHLKEGSRPSPQQPWVAPLRSRV